MPSSTLEDLTRVLLEFRAARNWRQFHNPKDQAISLNLEAAELLEYMQWRNGEELQSFLAAKRQEVAHELADILGWVLLIAHDQQIDLTAAFAEKQQINKAKYPIDKAFGKATKYDQL